MIKERYVSPNLAVLLRDKGFDQPCRSYYDMSRNGLFYDCGESTYALKCVSNSNFARHGDYRYVSAPTHQMVQDWLLEKYQILVTISDALSISEKSKIPVWAFTWKIKRQTLMKEEVSNTDIYPCMEEALTKALRYIPNEN